MYKCFESVVAEFRPLLRCLEGMVESRRPQKVDLRHRMLQERKHLPLGVSNVPDAQ